MSTLAPNTRLHYIDWLRVLAFVLLVPYHAGLVFVDWGFHIQNAQLTEALKPPMLFLNQWRLPLLFFVSGAGTCFALRRRTGGAFARGRLRRLLLPLVAGILLVIPPQVYLERLHHGIRYGSYGAFYPHFFEACTFTWNHLWFIVYLLTYSLLLLPLFLWLRRWSAADSRSNDTPGFWAGPYRLLLLALPLFGIEVLLRGHWPDTRNLVADWYNFAFYLTCLLYGFGLALDGSGWVAMERQRWTYLGLGVASFSLIYWGWHAPGTGFLETSAAGVLAFSFFKCLNIWSWVLCFIGFGRRYLQRSNAFFALHQPGRVPVLHPAPNRAAAAGLLRGALAGRHRGEVCGHRGWHVRWHRACV